jgi:hypothetical protein
LGVIFGFAFEYDFAAKLGGKWCQKRSPKLKFVLHWGSSSEELPKINHAHSPSGITKNVYFQPGRSGNKGSRSLGQLLVSTRKKSLIKYDRLDGSSPVYFPAIFPQGADLCSWHLRLMSKRGDIKAIAP